jgi:hypothetical protein
MGLRQPKPQYHARILRNIVRLYPHVITVAAHPVLLGLFRAAPSNLITPLLPLRFHCARVCTGLGPAPTFILPLLIDRPAV